MSKTILTEDKRRPVFICGGDFERLAPRGDCPDALHDWPLPAGYGEAHDAARNRFGRGWSQARCPHCHLYGWRPGVIKDRDVRVPAPEQEPQR